MYVCLAFYDLELISSWNFLVDSSGFSMWEIMSSAKRDHFIYSFLIWFFITSSLCSDQTSRFSKSAESRHAYFHVPTWTLGGREGNDEGGESSTRWYQLNSRAHSPVPSLLHDDGVLGSGGSSLQKSREEEDALQTRFVQLPACRPGLPQGNPDLSQNSARKKKRDETDANCLMACFVFMF